MKIKRYLILAAVAAMVLPQTAQGDIVVAGWDTWDSPTAPTATVTAAGVTASATASTSAGDWSIGDTAGRGSSKDTTWGTFDGDGNAASAITNVGPANMTATNGTSTAEVSLTITNNGAADLDLSAFHMDVLAFRPNAPRTYTLNVVSGDITTGLVSASAGSPMNDNSTNDITHLGGTLLTDDLDPLTHDQHDDLNISLAGLADNTLAIGESAVIQIAFSNGTGSGGGHHLFLDNVAVSGDFVSAIPEPSSLALLGFGGLGMLIRRRK